MKLKKITIQNIRGIRNLTIDTDGKNIVVWVSNGSGKSTIVDSIDFLLTGQITRLMGKGTGDINLKTHGKHIDADIKDARVEGVFEISGKDVILVRNLAKPNDLEVNPKEAKALVMQISEIAKHGTHVLTRREILKYVTSESATRAGEIQSLLSLDEVERVRKIWVSVKNNYNTNSETAKRIFENEKANIASIIKRATYDETETLSFINRQRYVLGGKAIEEIDPQSLKQSLHARPKSSTGQAINITLLNNDLLSLSPTAEKAVQITELDHELREVLGIIRKDEKLLKSFQQKQLIDLGLDLLDDSGSCPLCETEFLPGILNQKLEHRKAKAQIAEVYQEKIARTSKEISQSANIALACLGRVIPISKELGVKDDEGVLRDWQNQLNSLVSALADPIKEYNEIKFSSDTVRVLLAPQSLSSITERILKTARDLYPESTPEQTAWDILTKLEDGLKRLLDAQSASKKALLSLKRVSVLHDEFIKARDEVLGKLYDQVKERFVKLYQSLHGEDEEGFDANIKPEKAGLRFEVNFRGHGYHPPHALHSEGHQDSMGICLYFALAERLTGNLINLIILDDVVMSVDSDHRRNLCRVLAKEFPGKQFLITTHDKTWVMQLKAEGVVKNKQIYEFFNWDLETGPKVKGESVDIWKDIDKNLVQGQIPTAAHALRRWGEEFFGYMCENLQAPVRFRIDSKYELGDLLPAALGKYKDWIGKAKTSAQSWQKQDDFERLNEFDSQLSQVSVRFQAEQPIINANVHYNEWANFSAAEFQPVVDSFKNLYNLFTCPSCHSYVSLSLSKVHEAKSIECNCGQIHWNLTPKPKGK